MFTSVRVGKSENFFIDDRQQLLNSKLLRNRTQQAYLPGTEDPDLLG